MQRIKLGDLVVPENHWDGKSNPVCVLDKHPEDCSVSVRWKPVDGPAMVIEVYPPRTPATTFFWVKLLTTLGVGWCYDTELGTLD